MQLVDGVAGEAEHRGQQGERCDEDHQDGGDARRGQADHVRLAYEEEAEQRDHHGAPGEEDRPTRGHEGGDDGIAGVAAFEDALPVAGDDEEGVVDAHTDADHGGHFGREVRDGQDVREELKQADPDTEARQRGDDRQAHGHHRSEGEQHDEDGGGDADALTGPGGGGGRGTDRGAAELGLEAPVGRSLCRGDRLLDGQDGDVDHVGRKLDLGEGDVALARLGDLVHAGHRERAGHALHPGQRLDAGSPPCRSPPRWPPWQSATSYGRRCRPCRRTSSGTSPARCSLPAADGVFPAVNLFSKWVPAGCRDDGDADDGQERRESAVPAGGGGGRQPGGPMPSRPSLLPRLGAYTRTHGRSP